ncbi:MAG: cation:proton antiporter domain-containing protein [Ginsengibacter sp.]
MKKHRNIVFYVVVLVVFSGLIRWVVFMATQYRYGAMPVAGRESKWIAFKELVNQNFQHPLAILLMQIITIVFVARFFGLLFKKIGQPTVIGEIVAGIFLGPSILGAFYPSFTQILFPPKSMANLQFLSQVGLILFMFVVGMELDFRVLRKKTRDAVIISHTSIIFTLFLGFVLAYLMFEQFAPAHVPFLSFGLFVGIGMTITAFPVMARIVQERGIHKSKLGTLVIACAAIDDITSWCLLAAVIAIVNAGSIVSSFYTIGLALVYIIIMVRFIRPFLRRVAALQVSRETLNKSTVALFLITLIISSYITEVIGIKALFGAFMAGAVIPENMKFKNVLIEKVEDVALILLLPLFFVYTGLRTQIGLLDQPVLWKLTALTILFAVVGKGIGATLSAKWIGQNWRDSLSIGTLINTRGLMGLIALNIGYDLGILSPEIFTMLVIMAMVTTLMTGPALNLINRIFIVKRGRVPHEINQTRKYKILVASDDAASGASLIRVAHSLVRKISTNASITVMHLAPSNELHYYNIGKYEKDTFAPLLAESERLHQEITPLFKVSKDINTDIVEVANNGDFDLLLIAVGKSIFEGSILGRIIGITTRIINPDRLLHQVTRKENLFENVPFDEKTRLILSKVTVPVGVLFNKRIPNTDQVFMPVFSVDDAFLIKYAQRLIKNSASQVTILDVEECIKTNHAIKEEIRSIQQTAPNHINLITEKEMQREFMQHQDMMFVSASGWKKLINSKNLWLSVIPSLLVLTEGQKVYLK